MREWLDRCDRALQAFASESEFLVVGYNTPQIHFRRVNKIVKMASNEAGIQEDSIELEPANSSALVDV